MQFQIINDLKLISLPLRVSLYNSGYVKAFYVVISLSKTIATTGKLVNTTEYPINNHPVNKGTDE